MHVLTKNNAVEKFPYSFLQLTKDNPNVSFPDKPSDKLLASWGVYAVHEYGVDYDPVTQVATKGGCVYNEELDRWEISWTVRGKTAEELAQETADKAAQVRAKRDKLLVESDWTQGKDIPDAVSTVWATYRQALRDLPAQQGFPSTVVWPVKPE